MENKTGKYFKYAIGEIILVVIGILIALQINNWNELKKKEAQEIEQLTYVLENLKTDSLSIQKVISDQKEILQIHKNLVLLIKGELTTDSVGNIDLIRRSFPYKLITRDNNPNLANDVLSQELKKEILNYFSAINFSEFVMKNANDLIEEKVRPYLGDKHLLNFGNQFINDQEKNDQPDHLINREKFFEEIQKPELQNVLFEAGIKISGLNNWKTKTALENEKLKTAIHEYLSNK